MSRPYCKGVVALAWLCVASFSVTAQELAINTALERTLTSSPQLQLYPYQLRIDEAKTLQAGLKPNPELGVSVENVLGNSSLSGVKSAELTLTLSQLVELGDKRQRRLESASLGKALTQAQYELDRVDVLAKTMTDYLDVLELQTVRSWTAERLVMEQNALQVATERSRAGLVTDADVLRLKSRVLKSQMDLKTLKAEQQVAVRQLAANWANEPDFDTVQGQLAVLPMLPSLNDMLAALDSSPQLGFYLTQERLAGTLQNLAIANGQTDLTIGAGVRRNEQLNENAFVFSVSMPLALSNPNAGEIEAARVTSERSAHQLKLSRQQLQLSTGRLYQQLTLLSEQIHDQQQAILPAAESVVQSTLKGYETGIFDMTDLLSAHEDLLSTKRNMIDAQAQFHRQLVELERLVGMPLVVNGPAALPSRMKE
jgi:cobalt-zinc-cadmium efflux system outer membrane protein